MVSRSLQVATALAGLTLFVLLVSGAVSPSRGLVQEMTPTETPAETIQTTPVLTETVTATLEATQTVTATLTAGDGATPTLEATDGAASPSSTPGAFGKAEIDKIFPPGRGQDLVFTGCVNCHPWVPIVLVQGTAERWQRILKDHRARVGMSDDDFAFLTQYLIENFGPDKPVPDYIPPDLLQQWTSY
jgi:hypothetical protein